VNGGIRPGQTRPPDEGSITAETAVVLPSLLLVVMILLGVTRLIGSQLAVEDAARLAARAAARGDSLDVVVRAARSVAPPGTAVSVVRGGGLVTVEVTADVHPAGAAGRFVPQITVAARAVAADEAATPEVPDTSAAAP
jgi:Flp pilus assembly protein TadG